MSEIKAGDSMALDLFKHNIDAYNSAITMLAETGKAAVIHPTGTGKSFIGFKLCEDNPDKTICWLSPSDYIYRTQLENLKETSPDTKLDNVKYFTYVKLMNLTEAELSEIKPDYIVLDEFHRAGAELWGEGVRQLLNAYPDAKLLGLSATAVRYLDNQRDMADELFDGNIASEMTLGEAIVRGILNPPKYVLSIFSYQESLAKYEIRVQRTKNKAVRDKAEKYLEALRRALDKADGLDIIFDKHMTDRTGKYIVFCANFEAMQDAIDKVGEWFGKIDAAPHIYSVYSLDGSANKNFDDFRADEDNTHLRLLFCIDALNEGIHVENVSGVILLRPTVSPIIYKQQIGRALSASKTTVPVIFDIVNNIENLYSIDSIKDEMQVAIQYFREYDRDYDIVNDSFDVTDEVRECVELFNELEETLTASWDIMFMEAKRYFEENGDLLVPQVYVNENGYRVGQWVSVQRTNYKKKQFLSDARIRRLESIGMCWDIDEKVWNDTYQKCVQHYEKYNTISNIKKYSVNLAQWLVNQRLKYRDNELPQDRIDKLNAIGMVWDLSEMWEHHFEAAKRFYEENGHLNIQAGYVTADGLKLGQWFRTMRQAHNDGTLSEDKEHRLKEIGMKWDSFIMRNWLEKYRLAKAYYAEHGNSDIKSSYTTSDGTKLGTWVSTQRYAYQKGTLTDEQIELLKKIDFSWDRDQTRWEKGFAFAKRFVDYGGDINALPNDYMLDGFNLTRWIRQQRSRYNSNKLSQERIERLEGIGLKWVLLLPKWQNAYDHAREFFLEHGDLNVYQEYECDDGFKLGIWIVNQRTKYREGRLDTEQIAKLEAIGMIWNKNDVFWENGIAHAKAFYSEHGNLNIPQKYVCSDGYHLGHWIIGIRAKYKAGNLPSDRIAELESLGIEWERKQNAWEKGYAHAKAYFDTHGNMNISTVYVCEDGYKLGQWKRGQLRTIKSGTIKPDRLEMLRNVGITV